MMISPKHYDGNDSAIYEDEDALIRQVLIDAIKMDMESANPHPDEPMPPSAQHQREMEEMLKNPAEWASRRLENVNLDA